VVNAERTLGRQGASGGLPGMITDWIMRQPSPPRSPRARTPCPPSSGRLSEADIADVSAYVEEMAAKGWTDLFRSELIGSSKSRPPLAGFLCRLGQPAHACWRWRARPQGRDLEISRCRLTGKHAHGHGGEPQASSFLSASLLLDSKLCVTPPTSRANRSPSNSRSLQSLNVRRSTRPSWIIRAWLLAFCPWSPPPTLPQGSDLLC